MDTHGQKVYRTLKTSLGELTEGTLESQVRDGTMAAELHAYYVRQGLREGWVTPGSEYDTPLSRQDETNQRKNIFAARDVLEYWIDIFDFHPEKDKERMVLEMEKAVRYKENRGNASLEIAAKEQHEQWKRFVKEYQAERITPGHAKFRKANYEQYQASYGDLPETEKDKDREIVAVVTDMVLARADIRPRQIAVE